MLQVIPENTLNFNSYLFRRQGKTPSDSSLTRPRPEREEDLETQRALRCASCGHVITTPDAHCERNGSHEHMQVNPHGVTFAFGCFSDAPGVVPVSPPASEFSWFAGYEWQITECANCQAHMGWLFSRSDDRFYGLLFEQLFSD